MYRGRLFVRSAASRWILKLAKSSGKEQMLVGDTVRITRGRAIASAYLRRPIISASRFNSHIILPQIFVFVALMVIGSLQGVELASVLQRCLALIYLFATSVMVRGNLTQLSLRFCVAHLCALGLLLSVSAVALGLDELQAAQIPFAGMLLIFASLNISVRGAGILCVSVLGVFCIAELAVLIPFAISEGVSPLHLMAARLLGWYILLAVGGSLMLLALVRKGNFEVEAATPVHDAEFGNQLSTKGNKTSSQDGTIQELRVFHRALEFTIGELRSTFFWRLSSLGLINAVTCLALLAYQSAVTSELFISWLAVSLLYGLLLRGIYRRSNVRDFYLSALSASTCALLWWCMLWLRLAPETSYNFGLFLLAINLVAVISLPWPDREQILLISVFFVCGTLQCIWDRSQHWSIAFFATALVWSIFRGSEQRVVRSFQIGQKLMRVMIESTPPATLVLRMMSWYFRDFFQADRVLVLQADTKFGNNVHGEVIGRSGLMVLAEQELFLRGLVTSFDDTIRVEHPSMRDSDLVVGLVQFSRLGEQFVFPAIRWFGLVPKSLAFVRLLVPRGEREAWAWIVVPLSEWRRWWWSRLKLVDVRAVLREISTVPRLYFATTRSRVRSADELSASERAASRSDAELSEVVHVVNNCVQEITAACDKLARSDFGPLPDNQSTIDYIERTAFVLGASVSDVRLLNELAVARAPTVLDRLPLTRLMAEVLPTAEYLSERKGVMFRSPETVIGAQMMTANADLASSAVRLLFSVVLLRARRAANLELRIGLRTPGEIQLMLCDDFTESYDSVFGGLSTDSVSRVTDPGLRMRLTALDNFMRASGGSINFAHQTDWLPNRAILTFHGALSPVVEVDTVKEPVIDVARHWILLVDDNPQMTDFYARVAEALELSFETADSLKRAREVLIERGAPQILVTDVQLGDGSGLDLVKECRIRFGETLPVIVVSGEVGLASDTLKGPAGTNDRLTCVLSKPVGRRRLFDEMRILLAFSQNSKGG